MRARDEDLHLWTLVAATVRPLPGRPAATPPAHTSRIEAPRPAAVSRPHAIGRHVPAPQGIEPRRFRRLALGREPLRARIDLHGLNHDAARAALTVFIEGAFSRGERGVLVITGKGALGDGVLRRGVPEWLADTRLRPLVAGLSEAHRRHGGAGALYVALRRPSRA